MEEERRELVQTVEHQRVLPDNDGEHQGAHAEDIVSLMVDNSFLLNTIAERERLTLNQSILDMKKKVCSTTERLTK